MPLQQFLMFAFWIALITGAYIAGSYVFDDTRHPFVRFLCGLFTILVIIYFLPSEYGYH